MPVEVRRTFVQRNKWFLPILLALIVAALIGGALLVRSRAFTATRSTPTPTATPQVKTKVVTATPSGVTATPGGPPTPTLVSAQGGSTPLPGATPVPTVPGLTLGEIIHPQHEVVAVQKGADGGDSRYTYHLSPLRTVMVDLVAYGFKSGGYTIVSPSPQAQASPTPARAADGRPVVRAVITYRGKQYTVAVAQAATRGPRGTWLIVSILPGRA